MADYTPIALLIAGYGAALSTYIYLNNWSQDKLKIKVGYKIILDPPRGNQIQLIVKNVGKRSIYLHHAYVEIVTELSFIQRLLNKINKVEPETERINYTEYGGGQLEGGEGRSFFICNVQTLSSLNRGDLKRYRGVIVDQLENKYYSKSFKL